MCRHFFIGGSPNPILSLLIRGVCVDAKCPSPATGFAAGILPRLSIGLPRRRRLMLPATCKRALGQWDSIRRDDSDSGRRWVDTMLGMGQGSGKGDAHYHRTDGRQDDQIRTGVEIIAEVPRYVSARHGEGH